MSDRRLLHAADVERIVAADRAHLWHPYTPMDEWRAGPPPPVIVSARGASFELADDRRLLDGNSSWWVAALGHDHPRVVSALTEQAARMCHVALAGVTHPEAALLAEELAAVSPAGLDQVFFTDDGSTAIEAAVKMAVQYHLQSSPRAGAKKRRFVALDGAFHGETVGATSLGGVEVFRRPFAGVVFDCVHAPSPASPSAGCGPS